MRNPGNSQSRSRGTDELANMRSDEKRYSVCRGKGKCGKWWSFVGSGAWITVACGGVLEEGHDDDGREQVMGRGHRSSNRSLAICQSLAIPPTVDTTLSTKP